MNPVKIGLTPEIDLLIEGMLERNGIPCCEEWDILVECAKTLEIERDVARRE